MGSFDHVKFNMQKKQDREEVRKKIKDGSRANKPQIDKDGKRQAPYNSPERKTHREKLFDEILSYIN